MPTRDLTVIRVGTDTSGRGLYMTKWMFLIYTAAKRHPLIQPFAHKIVVVQGAFMIRNGGGASASEGFHNYAGCIDIRTWNLTTTELNLWIRVTRMLGFAFWRRDWSWQHGGMSPHAHGTLGSDAPLGSGAAVSWRSYLTGGDGLSGPGRDYEWRPSPLVTWPPTNLLEEDYLMTDAAERKLDRTIDIVLDIRKDLNAFRTAEYQRDKEAAKKAKESKAKLVSAIGGVIDALSQVENQVQDTAGRQQLNQVKAQLLDALKNDPDVDGADNPA